VLISAPEGTVDKPLRLDESLVPEGATTWMFADAFGDDAASVHEDAIDQLAAPRVTMGLSAGRFRRGLNVRRDQMASFLSRLLSRLVSEGAVAL
jgi:hypothetical protein